MNEVIGQAFGVVITPWKLVGYLGVLLFAGRWVVQVLAARRLQRPVIPRLFWTMSMAGSAL
ncbi:MAG TPA: lipid-A-disaccharide synthase N-terminal domain-containing protein, partial [Steroidobacteraceae bacterium]|nr:lipid-A-disaccharide synthase N-terminal domain-containing protein [Steroidobacteraceae bacterium]